MPRHDADAPLPSWSFPLRIHPGELLSSWLSRSVHLHGIAPYAFLSIRLPGARVWDRDVDRGATATLLADLDRSAGLTPGRAAAASLSSWLAVLAAPDVGANDDARPSHVPFLLSAGIHHRTRRLHGLQFCSACLREGERRFERVGRLAFVVGCSRHGTAMLDACPSCDAPVTRSWTPVNDREAGDQR